MCSRFKSLRWVSDGIGPNGCKSDYVNNTDSNEIGDDHDDDGRIWGKHLTEPKCKTSSKVWVLLQCLKASYKRVVVDWLPPSRGLLLGVSEPTSLCANGICDNNTGNGGVKDFSHPDDTVILSLLHGSPQTNFLKQVCGVYPNLARGLYLARAL